MSSLARISHDDVLTFNEVLNTLLTISQRVQKRPSHPNGFRTEAQCLDDICTASDTAVDIDFEVLKHFGVVAPDLEKREKRGRGTVYWSEQLSAA